MTSVLVLLAACNGSRYIGEQIDSILSQKLVQVQVIVGDDHSMDGTLQILDAISSSTSKLCVTRYAHQSGGAGPNFLRLLRDSGLDGADFLAFSDQDDIWNLDKLSRAVSMLDAQRADGYSSAVTAFWPDGREKILDQMPNLTDLDFLFEGAGQGCTFVLRGDFARQVQKFVRDNHELLASIHYHDWLIYGMSRSLGKRWIFDPAPSMRYRQHGNNDTGARGALAGVKKRLGLISNGWYANQVQQMIVAVSALDIEKAAIPVDFIAAWERQRGLVRRLQLTGMLFTRGRRRFSDRAVLAVSALLGWL